MLHLQVFCFLISVVLSTMATLFLDPNGTIYGIMSVVINLCSVSSCMFVAGLYYDRHHYEDASSCCLDSNKRVYLFECYVTPMPHYRYSPNHHIHLYAFLLDISVRFE
eukprot:888543_1